MKTYECLPQSENTHENFCEDYQDLAGVYYEVGVQFTTRLRSAVFGRAYLYLLSFFAPDLAEVAIKACQLLSRCHQYDQSFKEGGRQ